MRRGLKPLSPNLKFQNLKINEHLSQAIEKQIAYAGPGVRIFGDRAQHDGHGGAPA